MRCYMITTRRSNIFWCATSRGAHAAQGYACASGCCGVVFATSGPGYQPGTGLADAMIDSTPVVCITGRKIRLHPLGTDVFQETDVINITTPVTKWNYQVTGMPTRSRLYWPRPLYIANSGRPGPVVIDITKNAQLQKFTLPVMKNANTSAATGPNRSFARNTLRKPPG